MVGPRSSGCRTCVRRRIRCDGRRPHCRRCEIAGFQCAGFSTPIRFMSPITLEQDVPAIPQDPRSPESKSTTQQEAGASSSSTESEIIVLRDGRLTLSMPGLAILSSLNSQPSSYTDDTRCIFFLDRYFRFDSWNDDLQSNKTWFWKALQSPTEYPISNAACRALTATFFAQVHKTGELDQYVQHQHGLALRTLVTQLQTAQINFDVLAANTLLVLYEVCSRTSQRAWLQHVKAMQGLYQSMGPEFFKKRPARSLLMLNRYAVISAAIFSRERCFLAEEQWLNILVSDDREASLAVKLGDMVVHVPEIFGRIQELPKIDDPSHASSEARQLFDSLLQHLHDLRDWWRQWSSDPRRLPTRATILPSDEPMMHAPPSSPNGQPLTFCNLDAAASWCRYHAHVILALVWMRRLLDLRSQDIDLTELYEQYPNLLPTGEGTSTLHISDDEIENHAVAVCEGLHFYSLPRYRHIGAAFMGMPVRVAWQTLPSGSPCSVWAEELIEFMDTHSGFSAPRHILQFFRFNIECGSKY